MRDGQSPASSIAASFAPAYRVWMRPYALGLGTKEKVGVEFVGRDRVALRGLECPVVSYIV